MGSPAINENAFLLYSLGMGIVITFVYDLFRIWRRVCIHNRFFVSLEDLIFWFFCAVSVFYLMHTQSNGTLRWFAVLGALTGMLAYKKTISPFFVKWMSAGLCRVLGLLGKFFRLIGKPFCFLLGKGRALGKRAGAGGSAAAGFLKKRLTAFLKMLKIALCKQ